MLVSETPRGAPRRMRLSAARTGACGVVRRVSGSSRASGDRLAALGVWPGARITVLQTVPVFVFTCDQSELAVETSVAHTILIEVLP